MPVLNYTPGSLIRARGRDWVIESDSTPELLHLRPLAGSASESCWLIPALEQAEDAPASAVFPPPSPEHRGNRNELGLLQSAMRMRMRSGAGPFRSFGNIAVQPRIYQLVPLLMALRQQVIRLLIADDVGIGKTIEAGLIVRELLDRGEISRFSVLCPPNLAEQWREELQSHFNIRAEVITSSSIKRLEKQVPPGLSIFEHHPYTIISLDYIKSDRHRDTFLNKAPECIVVDEAHTCTSVTARNHQRYDLLRTLADDEKRHMLMLTATPHSGIEEGFYHLLGLLDRKFEIMGEVAQRQRNSLREALARHLVQRRRKDIQRFWNEQEVLPEKQTVEMTYRLAGPWGDFFEEVRQYCLIEAQSTNNRMIWYAMLAMLRCISSSPASAISALEAKLRGELPPESEDEYTSHLADPSDDDTEDDIEAPAPELGRIEELLRKAQVLKQSAEDPKLAKLRVAVKSLLKDDYHPIIFCQYISTAEYVAEALQKAFPKYAVRAITGKLSPAERAEEAQLLIEQEKRILVATNCLSEGINLQNGFDAVVHYDLAWNPTRHEQREGRVDRFGQKKKVVRSLLLYGQNNPVDGFILKVILRKAETISNELGVRVPVPVDEEKTGEALVHAVLLNDEKPAEALAEQMVLDFDDYNMLDLAWKDASAEDKARATTFAQQALQPSDVMPEYERLKELLGTKDELRHFLLETCKRLGAPLESLALEEDAYSLRLFNLPEGLARRLMENGIRGDKKNAFRFSLRPAGSELASVSRAHPLVSTIADYLAELSLDSQPGEYSLPRCAVVRVKDVAVPQLTTLYNLRLRHNLTFSNEGRSRHFMAEELVTLIRVGSQPLRFATGEEQQLFTTLAPQGNVPDAVAKVQLTQALNQWQQLPVDDLLQQRADDLLQDHLRVREAARQRYGSVSVTCCTPPDLLSILICQPVI